MSETRNASDCAASWCAEESWCGLACAMDVLGNKWHPVVVHLLLDNESLGFGDISAEIGTISNKMLSTALSNLEADGVVDRRVVADQPVRVEYTLTEDGEQLAPAIEALQSWGETHLGH